MPPEIEELYHDDTTVLPTGETIQQPADTQPPEPKTLRDSLAAAYDESTAGKVSTVPAESKPAAADKTPTDPAVVLPTADEFPLPARLKDKPLATQWATLPKEVKAEFREYESNIGRLTNKFGKAAQAWEQTQQIVAPYQEMLQRTGGNFHGAVSNFFATARILHEGSPEQKLGLIREMVKAYNIPLTAESMPAATPGAGPFPGAANLSPEFLERFNRVESTLLTREAVEMQNVQTQVQQDLSAFCDDPKNAYVREPGFLDTMAALIQSERAKDLVEAYEKASWLHDSTRQLEIAKINQQRSNGRVERANRARQAGVSVNGNAPGSVKLDPSKLSLRDTLAAAYDGDLN